MPIIEYQCRQKHITEKIVLSRSNIELSVKCQICNKKAEKIFPTRTAFETTMFFGEKYGFAAPSDRKSWMKNNDVVDFVGPGT